MSYVSADCHSPPSNNQYRLSMIASVNYNQSRSVPLGLVECGHRSRATYERSRLRQKQALLEICFIPFGTPSFYQTSRSKNVPSPAHIFFVCHVQQLLQRQFLTVGSLKIQACLVYCEDVDCAQSEKIPNERGLSLTTMLWHAAATHRTGLVSPRQNRRIQEWETLTSIVAALAVTKPRRYVREERPLTASKPRQYS